MNLNYFGNKKGSVLDPIMTSAQLLAVSFTIFIALYVWFSFQTTFAASIVGSSSESLLVETMDTLRGIYVSMDYVVPILVASLMIVSTILAYKTGANFVLMIFSLIVWGIAMLLSAVFTNTYIEFTSSFPTVYAEVPLLNLIMTNLKWIVLVWLAIITLLTFRKNNEQDDASLAQSKFYTQQ